MDSYLAPNAADRAQIVPGPEEEVQDREAVPGCAAEPTPPNAVIAWFGRHYWHEFFRLDVTVCPACGGHMRIVAALTGRRSIQRYLGGVACRHGHRRLPWCAPIPSLS